MIADLKPYAEYKESGLPWLGHFPVHWETKRAKYFFREVDERSPIGKEVLLSVSHVTGVTPRSEKTISMFLAKSNVGHKLCRPDDIIINTLWAWMAALGVTKHAGIVSPAYGVYRPLAASEMLPQFVHGLLRTPLYVTEYMRRSTGVNSSRLRLYAEHFLDIPLVLPPTAEQAAIVRFLAWANGRLERAIRAKRKVIALLNEQKQAIIHRAVTRGLDPSVRLKPSGIASLGDIPRHWEVRRLKSLSQFVTSGSRGWARYYADAGSVFLRIGNISTTSIDLRLKRITYVMPPKGAEGERTRARSGDVLLSITAQIGAVGLVPNGLDGAFVNQHTALIRLRQTGPVARWVAYSLLSSYGKDQCLLMTNGGTKVGLTLDDVRSLKVLLPPLDEQESILGRIDRQTSELDLAISCLEREGELLREFRTRLVADVVTGKLDVRAAAAGLPDEPAADAAGDDAEPEDDLASEVEDVVA